ncbi:MAG: ATPase [Candidatus Fischerbacteria bacterium RBG_13_37_8]|uniref:ATPase n=1 Tax=Candidatus Fischerbacteria bacterium RBG_13_37_8 TaxID=1817863 RepID=A0A1F5VVA4_9BACT|nr:MAG: ATPase [Candidatus Fischerbacteria bacterium RBG_13_37_8]
MISEEHLQQLKGLTEHEVADHLNTDGYNELPASKGRSVFRLILEVTREPMFLLLVICGTIYLILGDLQEALMLLGFVFIIMGITIYQENKTERALEALRDLSSPRAMVIRDGVHKRIPGREVVRDDIIIINEGDRIPADAVLMWGRNLMIDESLLTGESVPVRKIAAETYDVEPIQPGGDDQPFLYSGSMVVNGQGVAKVICTGIYTELGKIGKTLQMIQSEETLLQKETKRLVKVIFAVALFLCLVIIGVYGITRGNWMNAVLSGLTLAMAMLPEEFPVVLTIFLALGAWRISKKSVLTRRVAAVEILGASTVLCVDKTGTLTQNKMSVEKICAAGQYYNISKNKDVPLPEQFHELIEYAILASKRDPFDPMEKALKELGYKRLIDTEHLHEEWPFIEEYPLSPQILALSHVWELPGKKGYVVSAKGAPEAIADLCHLEQEARDELARHVDLFARQGLRVLGVAKAFFIQKKLPASQHDFEFQFMGLIGLADPIRDTVPSAIKECNEAGIRVVMITGDYPVTAQNIAKQIGIENPSEIITGAELERMTPGELQKRIQTVNIFARVIPEQKLFIVNALKANGEIVAMTGDGVNDAPALKSSHIGIAMGERGTDVARESSDLVLLNDDFSCIVDAVKLGRRIFDNLRKAMAYIISIHVPIAGISLIPVILKWPLILFPVHIVFLELIIDPACSMIFEAEAEEANVMRRPPRNPKEPLFGKRILTISLLQGIFSLLVVLGIFYVALKQGQSEGEARAFAFLTLIVSNLCLILTNRSWSKSIIASLFVPNKALWYVLGGTIIFIFFIIYLPFFQRMFHFAWMHPLDIAVALLAGIFSIAWFELAKYFYRRRRIDLLR